MLEMKLMLAAMMVLPMATQAATIPVCSGGDREARKVTCLVDGDTGWESGVKWRALDVDTPEIGHAECATEKRLGIAARDRLRQLMAGGYTIEWSGAKGYYGRAWRMSGLPTAAMRAKC